MPSADPDDLVTALLAASDALLRESQKLFRPHGLTAAQFNVLNILAERPDGLSQRELSDLLVVDRSNVTGLLDRLEKAGWVRRTDHPSDRRVYQVLLTPAGHRLWAGVAPRYEAAVRQVTRGISGSRIRDAIAVARTLEENAAKWSEKESP
jgi:MarR family 2-MHQ and catechol resistance regulon transcriptional repressor